MSNNTNTSVNKEKIPSGLLFFHMCIIVIITTMLMSAKENIDLSGSEVIVIFSLVNLILNIDRKKLLYINTNEE